jgi:ComF family protein
MLIQFLIDRLGDWLSPPRCAACDIAVARDHVFCAPCASSVERCHARRAGPCETDDVDVAFGDYGGALAQAIRRLKYEERPYLARPLGALLRGACRARPIEVDAVVPVPLHPRRLVERGYNQSALLAAWVATELGAPLVTSALVRDVDTAPQVELAREERRANVATAFRVACPASVEGQQIALVDDVATTGATLGACRRILLEAGARDVTTVVLARTVSSTREIPLRLDIDSALDVGVLSAHASSGCAGVPMRANLRN